MSTVLLAFVRRKKRQIWAELSDGYFNYPNRLASVDLSGSLDYTIDGRDFTSPGLSASVYEFSLNFSLVGGYTRVFESRYPWLSSASPPSGGPDIGEFLLFHRPRAFWYVFVDHGGTPADAVIGTCTKTDYTRLTESDPWVIDDGPADTDIEWSFSFSLGKNLFQFNGGDAPSSGLDAGFGKGDGSDDEKIAVQVNMNPSGAHASLLPSFDVMNSEEILRLPWDDSWAAESAVFSDIFSTHLTDFNATDGGGHSGTCTISLDFT